MKTAEPSVCVSVCVCVIVFCGADWVRQREIVCQNAFCVLCAAPSFICFVEFSVVFLFLTVPVFDCPAQPSVISATVLWLLQTDD